MSKVEFAHTGINCRDIDATEAFFVKYFGYKRARVVPLGDTKIVFIKNGSSYFELFKGQGEVSGPKVEKDGPVTPGFRHLAFAVPDVEKFLKKLGTSCRVTLGPLRFDDFIPGWAAVWVEDLDGRIIEISQGYKDEN